MTSNNDTILTDDYVAELLASEAKDCSLKYSALGLEGFSSASRPPPKIKPNTRFLRHIIKETKNHNEALLAREAAESQARLKELAEAEESKRKKFNPGAKDVRRRQLGDIAAILSGRKPRRKEGESSGEAKDGRRAHKDNVREGRSSSRSRREDRDRSRSPHKSSRVERSTRRDHVDKEESRDRRKRRRTSPSDEEIRRSNRKHRDRTRSPREHERKHRHRSPLSRDDRDGRERSHRRHKRREVDEGSRSPKPRRQTIEDDSDPLEDFIGPEAPPSATIPRGRGAVAGSSGIDRRFSASYDPRLDVQPDADPAAENWDDAVEAFRDRQKWKQQGAERLRAAGFSDEQINKWEKSGPEGKEADMGDFLWSKEGEKREWDRGKAVGEDGETVAKTDWAR